MKHVFFFAAVFTLAAFGTIICGVDVYRNGQLHLTNAVVGYTSIMLAVAFAVPLRMREAVSVLTPFFDRLRQETGPRNVG